MLKEQQVVLSQCYAERSGLAKERSQLQVTQRLSHHHELENATKSVQASLSTASVHSVDQLTNGQYNNLSV